MPETALPLCRDQRLHSMTLCAHLLPALRWLAGRSLHVACWLLFCWWRSGTLGLRCHTWAQKQSARLPSPAYKQVGTIRLGSELPAGPSSASFTVQEPPINGVRVRHRYTNWFAEPAKSLRCPQQIICGASATVVRPFAAPQRPLQLRDH